MVKARKKLSKSAWILLAVIFIALIAVIILSFVGMINVDFLLNGADEISVTGTPGFLVGLALWESGSWVNTVIMIAVPFAAGMAVFYWLKAYIIGEEQVMMGTGIGAGYNPLPSTPGVAQKKDEVEIS